MDKDDASHTGTGLSSTPITEDALKGLKVAQLKVVCKERGLTGFSKLNKTDMIAKLLASIGLQPNPLGNGQTATEKKRKPKPKADGRKTQLDEKTPKAPEEKENRQTTSSDSHRISQADSGATGERGDASSTPGPAIPPDLRTPPACETSVPLGPNKDVEMTYSETPDPLDCLYSTVTQGLTANLLPPRRESQILTNLPPISPTFGSDSRSATTVLPSQAPKTTDIPLRSFPSLPRTSTGLKRPLEVRERDTIPAPSMANDRHVHSGKKPKLCTEDSNTAGVTARALVPAPRLPAHVSQPRESHAALSTSTTSSIAKSPSLLRGGKRFIPLATKQPIPKPSKVIGTAGSNRRPSCHVSHSFASNEYTLDVTHLDFTYVVPPKVRPTPISLPPKMSQRKQVNRYAVILSGCNFKDLESCFLGSKALRYAAYLTATLHLNGLFSGKRLEAVQKHYPSDRSNMFPYLQMRQKEVAVRKFKFQESFLGRLFSKFGKQPIDGRLWCSPDHEKQTTVALRFVLTRLFFSISVGGCNVDSSWMEGKVLDAKPLVDDELWQITVEVPRDSVHDKPKTNDFFVLEATSEVVGQPNSADCKDNALQYQLRHDWSEYVVRRISPHLDANQPLAPLATCLKWQHREDYDEGISRLWMKNIEKEGEIGALKLTVARRYILACVVGNSISGTWKSHHEMAQDFAGNSSAEPIYMKQAAAKVNLYLPAHHHVESVHFISRRRKALHPAIAAVHTLSGREYFILKDNGMQIGCEEQGVSEIWMEIIGCNNAGECCF